MWRGRRDDWDRPPDTDTDRPRGLSGPTDDAAPADEVGWSGLDPATSGMRGSRLPAALLAGSLAGAVGVALWVLITWQAGAIFAIVALAIGYLVGITVRWVGKGSRPAFGLLAAGITLASSLVGMVLCVAVVIAKRDEIPLREVLETLDVAAMLDVLGQAASPFAAVILFFAVYESFRMAMMVPRVPPPDHDESDAEEADEEQLPR